MYSPDVPLKRLKIPKCVQTKYELLIHIVFKGFTKLEINMLACVFILAFVCALLDLNYSYLTSS